MLVLKLLLSLIEMENLDSKGGEGGATSLSLYPVFDDGAFSLRYGIFKNFYFLDHYQTSVALL